MSKNKRLTAICLAAALSGGVLFAFDFGVELTNSFGIKNDSTLDWYTDHKETFWVTFPLESSGFSNFSVEGSLYAAKPANSTLYRLFLNLDLLRFTFQPIAAPNFTLGVDLGRFPVSDITGLILNQSIDGLQLRSALSFGNIDLFAGATTLLNARKGANLMTADDYADANSDALYVLGSSRLVGKQTFQFPQFIGSMDLVAEGVEQMDLRAVTKGTAVQLVSTLYGTLFMSGSITNTLYYSMFGTYQTGVLQTVADGSSYSENSAMGSIRLDMFPGPGNQLFAQFIYTPGQNDFFATYLPITFQSAGTLFDAGYANLMKASAGWSFNPVSAVNLDLTGNVFLRSNTATTGDSVYNSTEILGGATFKATSDLKFRLDTTLLFPNTEQMQYQATLKAILAL